MLATSKRLRSSSPPSSPLDQVTKRRRQTSFHQGPPPVAEDDDGSGRQPQWAMAGPSGWRGDVPPAAAAGYHRPAVSPWEHASAAAAALQQQHHRSPTARSTTTAPHPSSYFPHQHPQPVPSPLSAVHSPPSYFPLFPPASASSLQHATQGPVSMHTPRATVGAQHDSHAHHRNAPLFHSAFVEQHPPWSSSSSAASGSALGGAHGRPPDGMGFPGEYGLLPPHGAVTPLMGPPTLPVPRDDRANLRRASFGRVAEAEDDDGGDGGGAMQEDDDDADESDTWDDVAGTVHDNLQSLADSPYAGMNQLLHSLHRPRQPRPHVASSPYPHFAPDPAQHRPLHTTPQTPLDHGPGAAGVKLDLHESSATRRRYGDVNRQLGELVLNRRVGRGDDGEGG